MNQETERVFELHWRQSGEQQWRAVLTDPKTRVQYVVTNKLALRTVLADLAAATPAPPPAAPGVRRG